MDRFRAILAGAILLAAPPAGLAAKEIEKPPVPFGPPPEWDRYRALAEAALRTKLVDPDSARFTWDNGYVAAYWKPFLEGKVWGYLTCGAVNSRNRMGGFAGTTAFVVVIDDDQVRYADIARSATDITQISCDAAVSKRLLPPASDMVSSSRPSTAGFQMTVVPLGIYIADVAPGSSAARAGLSDGMTVTHVNGVALKGLSLAVVRQIIGNATGALTLTVLGHDPIRLEMESAAR